MLLLIVCGVASLATNLHHPGARLDVGAMSVVGHVRHADKWVVQSLAGCDATLLQSKINIIAKNSKLHTRFNTDVAIA